MWGSYAPSQYTSAPPKMYFLMPITIDYKAYTGLETGSRAPYIVPHSNAPETLPRILSAHKDLVKGHLSRTFD